MSSSILVPVFCGIIFAPSDFHFDIDLSHRIDIQAGHRELDLNLLYSLPFVFGTHAAYRKNRQELQRSWALELQFDFSLLYMLPFVHDVCCIYSLPRSALGLDSQPIAAAWITFADSIVYIHHRFAATSVIPSHNNADFREFAQAF